MRDHELFMKRLRKRFGKGIRFYMCGEYGDINFRPHYHYCLFNLELSDLKHFKTSNGIPLYSSVALDEVWTHGYTLSGAVTFQSAAYVARYIMKKINGEKAETHYETSDPITGQIFKRLPEFNSMSKAGGIGKNWYNAYKTDVYPDDFVIIRGKKFRTPKFYDRQFELDDPDAFEIIRKRRVKNAKRHDANNTPDRLRVRETIQKAKTQRLKRTLDGENQ